LKLIPTTYCAENEEALLAEFELDAARWRTVLSDCCGEPQADRLLGAARQAFMLLIPCIPDVGGDENPFTRSLVESARCLALYQAMRAAGYKTREVGFVLFKAILWRGGEPQTPASTVELLSPEALMERRRQGAERSQRRQYPEDYLYTFVPGDGQEFDYGYDFSECATLKFYRTQGASEFTPYYCALDFAYSRLYGLGLSRTQTLSEGGVKCDHRFKRGRPTELPPLRPSD
jgi:hypothetical protein